MAKKPLQKPKKPKWDMWHTVMAVIIAVLVLFLLWWWLAARYNWWPMNNRKSQSLTASQVEKIENQDGSQPEATGTNGGGTGGNNGNNGGRGSGGSSGTPGSPGTPGTPGTPGNNGTNGNDGGGDDTPPNTTDPGFLSFSAGLGAGENKTQLDVASAGVLNKTCTVLSTGLLGLGKQEVCVFKDGTKILTVTLLNDQIVSVARTGF